MISGGLLTYGPGIVAKILLFDELCSYYRSLVPKALRPNGTRYTPHITIVRLGIEVPPKMELWGKYDKETVKFEYEPIVYIEDVYVYMKVYSERIGQIREELGLPKYRVGFTNYHLTIGNYK